MASKTLNEPIANIGGTQVTSEYSVHDVKKAYLDGQMNVRQYNALMYKLSRNTFEQQVLNASGPTQAMKVMIDEMWQRFSNMKEDKIQSDKAKTEWEALQSESKKTGVMPETISKTPMTKVQEILRAGQTAVSILNVPAEMAGTELGALAQVLGAPPWMAKIFQFAGEAGVNTAITGKTFNYALGTASNLVRGAGQAINKAMQAPVGGAAAGVEEAATAALPAAKDLPAEIQLAIQDGLKAVEKYDTPLENKLAAFSIESAEQARGVLPVAKGAKLSANQLRRASHEIAQARADLLPPTSLEQIGQRVPGTLLNQEQMLQEAMTYKQPVEELMTLAAEMRKGNKAYEPAFDAAVGQMMSPLQATRGTQTELGRAVEILKATQPVQDMIGQVHDIYANFRPELAAAGSWDNARQSFANRLLEAGPQNVNEIFRQTRNMMSANPADSQTNAQLARKIYTNILLAAPRTWVKKGLGDIQLSIDKTLQYSFGGWMSPGGQGSLKLSDGILAHKAMLAAYMNDMRIAANPAMAGSIAKEGVETKMAELTTKGEARGLAGFLDYGSDPEKWAIPHRVFDNITSHVQQIGLDFGQYMAAMREARNVGITDPEAVSRFVTARMAEPTKESLMEGIAAAGDMTATNPLGWLGKFIQKSIQGAGVPMHPGWVLTPIFHIPANLTNRAFSNIPGVNLFTRGLAEALNSPNLVERDLALGRMAMAQMSSQFYWLMAKGGMLTGSLSPNPKERQMQMEAGMRPHSIKLGNTWYPTAWLGPAGIQSSIIADAAMLSDYYEEPDLTNMAGQLVAASAKAVAMEPWFEAWSRLAQGISDPEKTGVAAAWQGAKQLIRTPATVLTGGPIASGWAREMDPFAKSVDNLKDDIKQNSPWWFFKRDEVPNKLNPLTNQKEELPYPFGVGWLRANQSYWAKAARIGAGLINPITAYPAVSKDPVMNELAKQGVTFPNFRVNRGGEALPGAAQEPGQAPPVNLTSQEAETLIKTYATRKFDGNDTLRDTLEKVISDPEYQSQEMTQVTRKEELQKSVNQNLMPAFKEAFANNPDVSYRYATSGLKKMLDKITDPQERQQATTDYMQNLIQEQKGLILELQGQNIREKQGTEDMNTSAPMPVQMAPTEATPAQ